MPLATLKKPWGRVPRSLTVKLWPKAGCNAAAHSRVKTITIRPTWRPLVIRVHNDSIKNSFSRGEGEGKAQPHAASAFPPTGRRAIVFRSAPQRTKNESIRSRVLRLYASSQNSHSRLNITALLGQRSLHFVLPRNFLLRGGNNLCATQFAYAQDF